MNNEQINPFDDESEPFLVLQNGLSQYSLWPAFLAVPAGWQQVLGPDTRAACVAYVETTWTDIRPLVRSIA